MLSKVYTKLVIYIKHLIFISCSSIVNKVYCGFIVIRGIPMFVHSVDGIKS